MSRDSAVIKRYAKALFDAAREQHVEDRVLEDLKSVASIMQTEPELNRLLQHPNLSVDNKNALIGQLFQGKISELLFNTIRLLIERGREDEIPTLYEQYLSTLNDALGRANAIVFTPAALDKEELSAIAEHFGKLTGKQIVAENVVDTDLLGGIKVQIGDRLYDGSLSGKLERLAKTLKQSKAL